MDNWCDLLLYLSINLLVCLCALRIVDRISRRGLRRDIRRILEDWESTDAEIDQLIVKETMIGAASGKLDQSVCRYIKRVFKHVQSSHQILPVKKWGG